MLAALFYPAVTSQIPNESIWSSVFCIFLFIAACSVYMLLLRGHHVGWHNVYFFVCKWLFFPQKNYSIFSCAQVLHIRLVHKKQEACKTLNISAFVVLTLLHGHFSNLKQIFMGSFLQQIGFKFKHFSIYLVLTKSVEVQRIQEGIVWFCISYFYTGNNEQHEV